MVGLGIPGGEKGVEFALPLLGDVVADLGRIGGDSSVSGGVAHGRGSYGARGCGWLHGQYTARGQEAGGVK
ncbi:MAG TPA: hypothetical protein VH393_08365 [Ktedonobacterales bacterium]